MRRAALLLLVVVIGAGLQAVVPAAPAAAEFGIVTGVRGGGAWSGTGHWEQQSCAAIGGCGPWEVYDGPAAGSFNVQIGCLFICTGRISLYAGPNVATPFFFGTARKANGVYYVSGSAFYPVFSFVRVDMAINPNGTFHVVQGARTIVKNSLPLDYWTNYRGSSTYDGTLTSGAFSLGSV